MSTPLWLWMLVSPVGQIYPAPPATTRNVAWNNAREWWQLCAGGAPTAEWDIEMKQDGWKAKRVEMRVMG